MEYLFIAFIAILVAGLFVLLVYLIKKSAENKKEFDYFKSRLHKIIRNEALDKALNNYSKTGNREYWLLKAIEINQFGEKEHFFNLKDSVSIGRDFNSNNLFVLDENAEPVQCKIELHKELPYIKSVSGTSEVRFTFKKRNGRNLDKTHALKPGETVRIHSGDTVEFSETKIIFYVFNSNFGIV